MSVFVKFYKVTSLPNSGLDEDAFYYVENNQYVEAYLTDTLGNPKKIGNTQMIQELTQNINAGFFT
jgi:hypothetical protein